MYIGTTISNPVIEAAVLTDGEPQPLYRRPSDGKVFAAGIPGQAYTLRARNLTAGRIEILCAVDGRSTLKDEPADLHASGGMVVRAYETWEVTGWRVDDTQTAEFIFTDPAVSIAARATGSKAGAGVIGFAAYRESGWDYKPVYPRHPFAGGIQPRGSASFDSVAMASCGPPAGAAMDAIADAGPTLGTGMGATREDRVGRTHFTRASGEPAVLVIGYATVEALRPQGILSPAEPDAFPGAGTGYGKYAGLR